MSIALPIRVMPNGTLAQQDPFDAVLALFGKMAATTSATWPHARWFGLYEAFLEASRREKQDHEGLKDALNTALSELGASAYVVKAVTTGVIDDQGVRHFQITMADETGRARFGDLAAPS